MSTLWMVVLAQTDDPDDESNLVITGTKEACTERFELEVVEGEYPYIYLCQVESKARMTYDIEQHELT